ncbi:MAG: ABC transporter permease [Micromonosporaceae bacterium]
MTSATLAATTWRRRPHRGLIVAGIVVVWIAAWWLLRGLHTLHLAPAQLTDLHRTLNETKDALAAGRQDNPVFVYFFEAIRLAVDAFAGFFQSLIAQPAYGLPIPVIGWLGVVAIAAWISYAVANLRMALLAATGLLLVGLQGLWRESMDTLALTIAAVLLAVLFCIPLGIWAGLSDRFHRLITPVLDFMQTMPTFVYLAPLTLFFLIGPASATIATLIYAAPPVIRLTAHGIRAVPSETVEAAESLGSTRPQTLTKVLLPSAKRTIVLGVNQTMMAALAMVTIAALIDAPGLGKPVIHALERVDVGAAFNAGLAIVVLAIVLDRVTTAAAAREEHARTAVRPDPLRRPLLIGGGIAALVAVWFSRTYVWAAEFPAEAGGVSIEIGSTISSATATAAEWFQDTFSPATNALKDGFSEGLLNPLQALLVTSPWWLVFAVIVALSAVLGSPRAAMISAVCLALLVASGLWEDGMVTLTSVLVATAVVVGLGVVLGVWMGRNRGVDRVIRPVLDAGQVLPPFVYLVPFLALFATSRFTAIAAAVVYAVPVAAKIVADGIRHVSPTTVEAAVASGSSTWQTITKVQLPMARRALTLATNQGLIYVLSMVVVGGLVGAGALGFDVVAGFSQEQRYGKGLAAGLAIVLLGVMLDRISQAAARRAGGQLSHRT